MPQFPDALSVALRAVSFVLLLNAAGISIFVSVFGYLLPGSLSAVTKLGWRLAIGALVFVLGHHALEAARMVGDMSGLTDPAMQAMTLRSSEGAALGLRAVGLMLVALAFRAGARSRSARVLGNVGAVLAVVAFTLTGHTSVTPYRPVAAVLLILHLFVVAFWLGALWPLYLAARKEPPPVAARVIDEFSRIAAWVVPMILLAGVGLAVLLVPNLAVLRQPYGLLLLAKAAVFAVLMALASLNKWALGPACARGRPQAFKQAVVVEYILISAVLAVTATMTTFYSPEAP